MEIESKNRKIKFSKADEEECKRRGYSNYAILKTVMRSLKFMMTMTTMTMMIRRAKLKKLFQLLITFLTSMIKSKSALKLQTKNERMVKKLR